MKRLNLIGKKFGRWNVIGPRLTRWSKSGKTRKTVLFCRCDCGSERWVFQSGLINGISTSCGCRNVEAIISRQTTHGGANTAEYKNWQTMKTRCSNPKVKSFTDYGSRGITVCPEWESSFLQFITDMGPRPSRNHTVERIDNEKGYCKDNCRWATRAEQNRNKRNNRMLEYKGKTLPLATVAELSGVNARTLWWKLSRGVSVSEATNSS